MKKTKLLLPITGASLIIGLCPLVSCGKSPVTPTEHVTVTLYSQYGGFSNGKTAIVLPDVEKGQTLSSIKDYERPQITDDRFAGYEFITWLDQDGNEFAEDSKITSSIFITARFGEKIKTPENYKTDNWATVIDVCNKGFQEFADTYIAGYSGETEDAAKAAIIEWIKDGNSSKDVSVIIGEEVVNSSLRIIGVNHDYVAGTEQAQKAYFTFEFEEAIDVCVFDPGVYSWFNEEATPPRNAYLRRYLNNYQINFLPISISENIVPIEKTTWIGKTGMEDEGDYYKSTEKLFPLSMKELGFYATTGDWIIKDEGTIYEMFNEHIRTSDYGLIEKEYTGTEENVPYWTRSGYVEANSSIMKTLINSNFVTELGRANSLSVYQACGVAPAFCIGQPTQK